MQWIPVGKLIKTHGLKGEMKFSSWARDLDVYRDIERVTIGKDDGEKIERRVESIRGHDARRIIKLQGCDTIEAAEQLIGWSLFVRREDFGPLPEGEYYWFEVEGLDVYDEDGKYYGRVVEIMETGSNDVYVVQDGKREILLPMIESVVKTIDVKENKLIFHVVEGLL
jgi:16S rRNA processing protein RimM